MSSPLPRYSPTAPRSKATPSRLSADVKSALCAALKWPLPQDTFALKVPKSAKAAVEYLKQHAGEPWAEYIDTHGKGRDALQWRLPLGKFAAVYRATPNAP